MTLPTREHIKSGRSTNSEHLDIVAAYGAGVLLTAAEWRNTIDRLAIRDTLVENEGLSYDTVTDRIIELFAVGEDNDER